MKFRDKVFTEQVNYLYAQSAPSLGAIAFLALFIAFALKDRLEPSVLAEWLFLNAVVLSFRYGVLLYRRHRSLEVYVAYRLFAFSTLLNALVWGVGALVMFVDDSVGHQAFLGFVYAGIIAGASISLGSRKELFLVYMLVMLLPLIYLFLSSEGGFGLHFGAMSFLFLLFMSLSSWKYGQTIEESIRIRFENDELLARVQESQAQSERAREEAESAARMKSEFLANMSHEIRTPMNAIVGFTTLLGKTPLSEKQQRYINLIRSGNDSLLRVINDILDFSKIDAGKMHIDETEFVLRDEIETLCAFHTPTMEEKRIRFTHRVAEDIPAQVRYDRLRLRQILDNLLNNACKFTPEGGAVGLELRLAKEGWICLSVEDSGIGIPPEKLDAIFEAFTQADGSTTRMHGGTGLGLSIALGLARLMGGSLHVSSQLGRGSRFELNLPLVTPQDEARLA
ncbi:MAG: hypothetical protein JXK05_01510 [Campylobacterales bacterium]|nr:hypothetical protein [Campylobacterales bacterium]